MNFISPIRYGYAIRYNNIKNELETVTNSNITATGIPSPSLKVYPYIYFEDELLKSDFTPMVWYGNNEKNGGGGSHKREENTEYYKNSNYKNLESIIDFISQRQDDNVIMYMDELKEALRGLNSDLGFVIYKKAIDNLQNKTKSINLGKIVEEESFA